MIRITVWNEFAHEQEDPDIRKLYPEGIHGAIADFLKKSGEDFKVRTATLYDEECGLTEEVLNETDVLIWWGHMRHYLVPDEVVNRVFEHIQNGMGLIALHSAHQSKIFEKLLGTISGDLKWRETGDKEILWCVDPSHPIARGVGEHIILEQEETYGEHFRIPTPDELVFISWFSGGEVFRSGCVYKRSRGKIFYFRPGHESYPTYYNKQVQQVIINAVKYVYTPAEEVPYGYGMVESVLK